MESIFRKCWGCGETKDLTRYAHHPEGGYRPYCLPCWFAISGVLQPPATAEPLRPATEILAKLQGGPVRRIKVYKKRVAPAYGDRIRFYEVGKYPSQDRTGLERGIVAQIDRTDPADPIYHLTAWEGAP